MALVDYSGLKIEAGDDAAEAGWFEVSYRLIKASQSIVEGGVLQIKDYKLSLSRGSLHLSAVIRQSKMAATHTSEVEFELVENNGLAFDHGKIIACGIERLRGKIEHTDIAFSLMPARFTLTALQNVYEAILDKELLKAAFRRKISNMVEITDDYAEKQGHRPSRLYKRKEEICQ